MIFAFSASINQRKLHFPCAVLRQLPLCGLAADERLQAIIHRRQIYIFHPDRAEKYRSFFIAPRKEVQTKCQYPI